ncbi:MAG: hypothetical protein J2P45_04060 [Candidatus Dormibacteraeota bacterium]|nr:hypothetical protein [Candidatus Dormibacteraeota bacterium]
MEQVDVRDLNLPLEGLTEGCLAFLRGASRATIVGEPGDVLCRAHFEGALPRVRLQDGEIAVDYRRHRAAFSFLRDWRQTTGHLALNAGIPWRIEFRHGVYELRADLSGIDLRSIEVRGGLSEGEIILPRPSGTVPITVRGGVNNIAIRRPAGVPARFAIRGGASRLAFDQQHFGAIGGRTELRSAGFGEAAGRYDIEVLGGASGLRIETAEGEERS